MSAKKIKAARRSATRIEAIRPVPVAPKGWPLLTIRVLATLGLSIGTYLTVLHYQAGTSGTIDSPFCGVGTLVNCSAVLGSAYARILSLPVALWAAAMYAAVLVVSLFAQTGPLILLCGWMFAFSVYMAGLSLLVIKSLCLLCLTLYTVNTGLLISAVSLARASAVMTMRQAAYSLVGYVVLVAGIGWWQAQAAATVIPPTPISGRDLSTTDEDFVRYYHSLPLVILRGAERHTKGPLEAPLTISEFVDFR